MASFRPEPSILAKANTPFKGDVLLIHGIFDTGYVFTHIARAFSEAGWNAHTPNMKSANGSVGLDELARQISTFMAEKEIGKNQDTPWILVGFSMGGLVARALLQNIGVRCMPKALITIGSPHYGSLLTYLFWGKGTRDMRPSSQFLKDLNRSGETLPENLPCYSLWTPLDLMIIPASSSLWKHAECEIYWALLHPWLLIHKPLIARIVSIANTQSEPDS